MSVDLLQSQNQIGVFIFLLPQSTGGEAFFCSPMYQTLRQSVSTRCACELSVFDGNDFSQLNLCLPAPRPLTHQTRNSKGNNCSNRSVLDSSSESTSSGLLLRVSNSYEQLLLARGNWLVQVVYKTVPSLHHLFLRLVGQYCTELGSSGYRRPIGAGLTMRSQGFKYTVLAAITHSRIEELRHHQSEYSLMDDLTYGSFVKSHRETGGQDGGVLMPSGGQAKHPTWGQKIQSLPASSSPTTLPSSTYPALSCSSNSPSPDTTPSSSSPRLRTETQKRDNGINSPSGLFSEYFRSLAHKQDEYLTALRQQYNEFFSPRETMVDRRGEDKSLREPESENNHLELDSVVEFSESTNLDSLTLPTFTGKPPTARPRHRDVFPPAEDWRRSGDGLETVA
ncbi:hypothetical protein SprV_0501931100 [Sparganum proliferum]